jgi:NTP pyrophosphatase (non-canonical NTP hydrolase)
MDFEALRTAIVSHQNERKIFADEAPLETIEKLKEEVEELHTSLIEAEIGGSALATAEELADVLIVLLTLADKCGIDILQATYAKQIENEIRSPKTAINNGYPDPYFVTKETYEMMGGKSLYYLAYLLLIAEED